MQGIWTKYDPVAFHYFAALEAHLRSKNVGRLHEDLLVKSRKLSKRSRDGDNSGLTTFKRASWCCYVAFDMLLEKFPDNNKTRDAMYMKGMSLVKLGRRAEGARQFHLVIFISP